MAGKGVPCLPRQPTWHADAATIADDPLRHYRHWHLPGVSARPVALCFSYNHRNTERILRWRRANSTYPSDQVTGRQCAVTLIALAERASPFDLTSQADKWNDRHHPSCIHRI